MKHFTFIILIVLLLSSCQSNKSQKAYDNAILNLEKGDTVAAISMLYEAITTDSTFVDPYFTLLDIYSKPKDLATSNKYYEKGIKSITEPVQLCEHYNNILYTSGQHREGVKIVTEMLSSHPDSIFLLLLRANHYLKLNIADSMLIDANKYLEKDPQNLKATYFVIYNQVQNKKYSEAIKTCNDILKINNDTLFAYYYIGVIHTIQEHYKEGEQYLLKVYSLLNEDNPDYIDKQYIYQNLLFGQYSLKKYDNVIKYSNSLIAKDSLYILPYEFLFHVYYDRGEYDKCIETYNKIVKIEPNYKYMKEMAEMIEKISNPDSPSSTMENAPFSFKKNKMNLFDIYHGSKLVKKDVYLGNDKYFNFEMDGKHGVIDRNGNILFDFKYDRIGRYSEGYFYMEDKESNTCGYVDENGKWLIAFDWGSINYGDPFKNGMAIIHHGFFQECYVNNKGEIIERDSWSTLRDFHEGLAVIEVKIADEERTAVIDKNGDYVVYPLDSKYSYESDFKDGRATISYIDNNHIRYYYYLYKDGSLRFFKSEDLSWYYE